MQNQDQNYQEKQRIDALYKLEILDTQTEERFDRITRMAQIIFDVPIALISLVDVNRQWFKSCSGLSIRETPRNISFCSYAIMDQEVFVIEDALKDDRFAKNPLVTGTPHIRFYAGRPIKSPDNQNVGTLCIIDNFPRKMSLPDRKILSDLSKWAEMELIAYTKQKELESLNKRLEIENKRKEEFFAMMNHEIKNPLLPIMMNCELLLGKESPEPEKIKTYVDSIHRNAKRIDNLINDISNLLKINLNLIFIKNSEIDLNELIEQVIQNAKTIAKEIAVEFIHEINLDQKLISDKKIIFQVLDNLIRNSLDFIPKQNGVIKINVKDVGTDIKFKVSDNGSGISSKTMQEIKSNSYIINQNKERKFGGTGLGLAICKGLIEHLGGNIEIFSDEGYGCNVEFTIPKENKQE